MGEVSMDKKCCKFKMHLLPGIGLAFLLLLSGCAGSGATTTTTNTAPAEPLGVNRILVLPFQDMYKVFGTNMSYRCPLCDSVYEIEKVAPEADVFLTDQLVAAMTAREDFTLIPPGEARGIIDQLVSPDGRLVPPLEILQQAGQSVGAEGILLGRVYRFEERVGAKFSAEKPASVTFDLLFIRVADGRILWTGRFEETQKSLSENLFNLGTFIKRKGKWITAREMAQAGLDEMLKTFPRP
jgi:hypothetical protein